MKKVILGLGLGLGLGMGLANAGEGNIDTKATATMEATCSISAEQIGFGAVATPLLPQSAQSDMTVKCSNDSAYTVELAYGGIYGSGGGDDGVKYTFTKNSGFAGVQTWNLYADGVYMTGGFSCYSNYDIIINNEFMAQRLGLIKGQVYNDNGKYGVCQRLGIASSLATKLSTGSAYAYGVMSGMSKGDSLAYSIQVPGDANKVWNSGNNSYKDRGNGENQTIPMIAKIVPDKSSSKYPAPDIYLDTVTASINY